MTRPVVDQLDVQIITLFTEQPGISVLEASRRLRAARPTIQARLNRLHAIGVIKRIEPVIDPAALGFTVTAICNVEINQAAGHQAAREALGRIPEILDMYTISGESDIIVRIVAHSNEDLQRVYDDIMSSHVVTRTRSSIVLKTHLRDKMLPLLHAAMRTGMSEAGEPRPEDRTTPI